MISGSTIVYFADPYCLWQRGLKKNTNDLLRQYCPKSIDYQKDRAIRSEWHHSKAQWQTEKETWLQTSSSINGWTYAAAIAA